MDMDIRFPKSSPVIQCANSWKKQLRKTAINRKRRYFGLNLGCICFDCPLRTEKAFGKMPFLEFMKSLVAAIPQPPSRLIPTYLFIFDYKGSIYHDMFDAFRKMMRVGITGAICYPLKIKNDYISYSPLL